MRLTRTAQFRKSVAALLESQRRRCSRLVSHRNAMCHPNSSAVLPRFIQSAAYGAESRATPTSFLRSMRPDTRATSTCERLLIFTSPIMRSSPCRIGVFSLASKWTSCTRPCSSPVHVPIWLLSTFTKSDRDAINVALIKPDRIVRRRTRRHYCGLASRIAPEPRGRVK